MFAISAKFRPSRTPGKDGAVCYRIADGSRERNICSGIRGTDKTILTDKRDQIVADLKTICCVVESLSESSPGFSLDDVWRLSLDALKGPNPYAARIAASPKLPIRSDLLSIPKKYIADFDIVTPSPHGLDSNKLLSFIELLIHDYKLRGKNLAKSYRSLHHSLRDFLGLSDIPLSAVDRSFILDYSASLSARVSPDTVSFYLRTLRSVLNNARKAKLIDINFDWGANVNVTVDTSAKNVARKALDAATIRQIATLDLSSHPYLSYVRDMFLFSFYAQGIELSDLANLLTTDLNGSRLTYRRRKRGRPVEVNLGDKAMALVKKYHEPQSAYLLPILEKDGKPYRFSSVSSLFSTASKEIGRMLPTPINLSFGMSRYSWIAIRQATNIAESLV